MSSTVTTAAAMFGTAGVAGSLALLGVLVFVALLVQKEVMSSAGERGHNVSRALNIVLAPLLIAVLLIAASMVVDVLR